MEARTAELAASEARYRGLIDNAPITDATGWQPEPVGSSSDPD